MGRANYTSADGCSMPCEMLHPFSTSCRELQKLGQRGWAHWGKSACSESQEQTSTSWSSHKLWTPPTHTQKHITYLIPLICPLKYNSGCCTVKRSTNMSEGLLHWNWAPEQAAAGTDSKPPALRPADARYSFRGEQERNNFLQLPSCSWCSVTAHSDSLHVLMLKIVIIPLSARLPCPSLRRAGVALSAAEILHCSTTHRNACCQTSLGHIAQTRTQKASAFPTLEHRESLEGREAASCSLLYTDAFYTSQSPTPSPINTCRVKALSSWVRAVTLTSDIANTQPFL